MNLESFVQEHWDNRNLSRSFIINEIREDPSWINRDWAFLTMKIQQKILEYVEASVGEVN